MGFIDCRELAREVSPWFEQGEPSRHDILCCQEVAVHLNECQTCQATVQGKMRFSLFPDPLQDPISKVFSL